MISKVLQAENANVRILEIGLSFYMHTKSCLVIKKEKNVVAKNCKNIGGHLIKNTYIIRLCIPLGAKDFVLSTQT